MSKHVKVKPCPHCGGDAEVVTILFPGSAAIKVECAKCGACTGYRATANAAISAWNKRAPSPAFEAMVEALEEAINLADENMAASYVGPREPRCQASYDKCVAALALARGER